MSRGIRDSLSEAIDGIEDEDFLEETRQEVITDDDPGEGAPGENEDDVPGEDDPGEGEEGAAAKAKKPDDKSEGAKADGKATSAESDPDAEASSDLNKSKGSIKAPASWKPAEREQWSKVPRPLQERIMAREKEISDNLTNTKAARETHDYVSKMGEHYGSLLQGSGFKHPLEAASAALDTMNVLSSGSPQQRAQEVARIIDQFGIDIEALDDAIVSSSNQRRQQQDPQAARLEQMLEQRLKPFNEILTRQQQEQQRAEQQKTQQAVSAVQQFADEAEFLNDVREDMADIIEIAAKRGVDLTLKQAYDRACAAHPEIANVLEERRRNEEITGKRESLGAKRQAASSVSGRKGGNGGGRKGMSLRETLEQAMDENG